MGPPHACHARGAPLLCCSVGLDEHVSDEEADPVDEDGDVRRALTEAFMAKSKRQPGVLGTGSGTDAAGLGEEGQSVFAHSTPRTLRVFSVEDHMLVV